MGWFRRFGAQRSAEATRTWSRAGKILAIGLLDGADLLSEDGWEIGEPWTLLRRDLTAPVPDPGVHVEEIGPERAHEWTAVLPASFDGPTFTRERSGSWVRPAWSCAAGAPTPPPPPTGRPASKRWPRDAICTA
ncbi:hypothetical protein [Nonomuraea sp. SBT364]|uniref:hypothetical protein n=1 Tax=Nonomuraea sp. SBT364 TaxID=1580530 RepID=UPI0012E1E10C|nr:hypothetical protein [Nonomuraea sp. SBT364]